MAGIYTDQKIQALRFGLRLRLGFRFRLCNFLGFGHDFRFRFRLRGLYLAQAEVHQLFQSRHPEHDDRQR